MLQRRKFDILRELLPPKTEIVVWNHLSTQQRELYNEFLLNKTSILRSLRDGETAVVLAAITRLKMLCGHPSLYHDSFEEPDLRKTIEQSAKLETMMHLVEKMTNQSHKILIFSQSTKMLNIIERSLLEVLSLSVSRIDGDTKERVRQKLVDDFNDPKSLQNVMLLSTKAGGVGITLTGADRVILFDPSWNPSEDDQAIGRAYRIGQTREVTVFRMITAGTVEEKMYERQLYKDGIRRVVLTTGDEVQRYFQRSELSKMFNLALPGECQTLEKAQTEGNDCSQSEFSFVRKFKNVLGLSRHDVFYKASDAAAVDNGHDGTKLAFSSVPTDVSNPRHILDNVMDTELAEIAMLGGIEGQLSNTRRPGDLPTTMDSFLPTSQAELFRMSASADRNVAKRLSYTPKATTEKKPTETKSSTKTPMFQFDDFVLNAPPVPVSKPREIIDIDSDDDDFSLSGGPIFSSVIKNEPEDVKPAVVLSRGVQLEPKTEPEDVKPAAVPSSTQPANISDRHIFQSNIETRLALPDCDVAPSPVQSEAMPDSESDISGDNHCLAANDVGEESTSSDEIMKESHSPESLRGMAPSPLTTTPSVTENPANAESTDAPGQSTSMKEPSIDTMLEQAAHFNQMGQPRRALQHLSNILDHHYDKLDEKAEVSLHEQIGSLVFQENPDYLT